MNKVQKKMLREILKDEDWIRKINIEKGKITFCLYEEVSRYFPSTKDGAQLLADVELAKLSPKNIKKKKEKIDFTSNTSD